MKSARFSDVSVLILLALARLLLHSVTNFQYGFHRDELAVLDDARYLTWGYVAYPPVTPLIARFALELFGTSLVGFRIFSALAQSVAMVLTGLMARELGGNRRAQVLASLAAAIAPIALIMGALLQYVSFEYLWWVLIAFFMIRLLKSDDPRWWLGIGAAIGLGMMTKYTTLFFVVGIVVGVLLTPLRSHLRSRWLWGGVVISLLIFLPNLVWQVQHNFISLEFLKSIHARDVRIGRTDGFLILQFLVSASVFTVPLWMAGLYFYFFKDEGRRYRTLGWMYVVPLVLLMLARGRFYYLAPAYPMLFAAGAIVWERWLSRVSGYRARLGWRLTWAGLLLGAILGIAFMLPVAPVNSRLWHLVAKGHDNFTEQIGWPELVETVAAIYHAQPAEEQPRVGILAGNYGEAGAINLYGPAYGLPKAISGTNSYWWRGFGDPATETLIVLGFQRESAERYFKSCEVAGEITNRFNVANEETTFHRQILLCRGLRQSWPEFWKGFQRFG